MPNKYQEIMRRLGVRYGANDAETRPNPITEEEFVALEAQLGHALPEDYKEFLRDYSNCRVHAAYPVWRDGSQNAEYVWIFFGLDKGGLAGLYHECIRNYDFEDAAEFYPGLSMVRSMEGLEEINWPPELLPIATSGGTTMICLALFGLRPGAIFFWKECDDMDVFWVADSFDEFMNLLYKDE